MTGEMSFKCLGFLTVYLEPKQKSRVQCFSKNSDQILAVTVFAEKLHHKCLTGIQLRPCFL